MDTNNINPNPDLKETVSSGMSVFQKDID